MLRRGIFCEKKEGGLCSQIVFVIALSDDEDNCDILDQQIRTWRMCLICKAGKKFRFWGSIFKNERFLAQERSLLRSIYVHQIYSTVQLQDKKKEHRWVEVNNHNPSHLTVIEVIQDCWWWTHSWRRQPNRQKQQVEAQCSFREGLSVEAYVKKELWTGSTNLIAVTSRLQLGPECKDVLLWKAKTDAAKHARIPCLPWLFLWH